MQKITPFLWFDNNLEKAMDFYTTVFKNSEIKNVVRYTKAGPGPEGDVLVATFVLEGQEFCGLNGGPLFKFTEAVSFFVKCGTQQEIDYFWEKLTADGGQESQCGWLKDKFGLSWQIVPLSMIEMLGDKNTEKAGAVMEAMMKMSKLDIDLLQKAYNK